VLSATRRIEWALGRTARAVGAEIEEIFHALPPKAISDLWGLRRHARRVLASRPARLARGPAQECSLGADLSSLPVLQLWPGDGGRFITFPLVFTEDPETHKRNLGLYRIHLYDAKTTGMHWQIGKGGGFHFHKAEKRGTPSRGGGRRGCGSRHAALGCGAAARGDRRTGVRGIPARAADATREGAHAPDARARRCGVRDRGAGAAGRAPQRGTVRRPLRPLLARRAVSCLSHPEITHRRVPLFQASVVGKPPQEDKFMGEAVQDMFTACSR
jgi:4-hydroxy-3-polyprenylbenzoate decarboxylase